jgi:exosortase/archaeosortase family protein
MKPNTPPFSQLPSRLKEKTNLFYFAAFLPLFLILYFNAWNLVIAFYGFVFLLLKSQKLRTAKEAKSTQRILGLVVIAGSFFIHYALILAIPTAGLYGAANYIIFLLGLFLVFFETSTLKEAFTPIFLIAAATSSSFAAAWLKPYVSPYLDDIAHLIVSFLRPLGVNAFIYDSGGTPIIGFTSLSGNLVLTSFVYECVGVFTALVFSIILVIILFEDPSGWKVRLFAAFIGVLGTFALNLIRVAIILWTDYFYGAEAGATVHYTIGYAFFSAWLIFFLYIYSKRKAIQMKIQSFSRKPKIPKAQSELNVDKSPVRESAEEKSSSK